MRTTVRGVSKRNITQASARACRARRAAHLAYVSEDTAATRAELPAAATTCAADCRTATLQAKAKAERACVALWNDEPSTYEAYKALASLSHKPQSAGAATLRHPDTAELCHTPQQKADAFGAHYAAMVRARPAASEVRNRPAR